MCESLADPKTRKRELPALSEAMTELKITMGTIVTRNDDESIEMDGGEIDVVPVWRFLLDIPDAPG